MRVVIAGAGGRMGRTLIQAVAASKGLALAGAVEAPDSAVIGRDAGELAGLGPNGIKVVSDVAPLLKRGRRADRIHHSGRDARLRRTDRGRRHRACHRHHRPFGRGGRRDRQGGASRATIVKSGNMSLGVNLLAALVKRVAKTLDDDYDIEILEMHHNKKIDAPSGTALMLGRAAAEGRGIDLAKRSARGRDGMTGARSAGDIGFASLRGGTVVGEHTRDLRRPGRAHRAHAPRRGPHDLRPRRAARGAVGARQEARALFDGGRAGTLTDRLTANRCKEEANG